MLGTRGVRLGVIKPGLYAMQVRALMEAAATSWLDRWPPDRRDHDPADRDPRGARTGPQLGRGRRGGGHRQGCPRRSSDRRTLEVHDRHHDRDASSRARRRPDRRGGRLLLLRDQRPDPDDLRLQPRRRRGPDHGRLPRAGPAQAQPLRGRRRRRRRRSSCRMGVAKGRATEPGLKTGVCGEHGGDPASIARSTPPASTT